MSEVINELRQAGRAFATMLLVAVRNPLWAFLAVITAPFRIWRPLGILLSALLVSAFAIEAFGRFFLQNTDYGPGSIPYVAIDTVTVLVLIWIIIRFVATALIEHFGDAAGDTHGSARFATAKETAGLIRADAGLLIGRDPKTEKLMRYDGPAHLLTMAPTRTGKGVGTIIPNLLTADRSVICIDPKGENAKIAGRARSTFGPVHIIDPFGVTGKPSSAFNPLDTLDASSLDVAEDASTLADALVFDAPGMAGEAHWNEEAKALVTGMILMVVSVEPRDRRHLGTLREYLTLAPDRFANLLTRMQDTDGAAGLIARAANRHLSKSDREAAGVLSAAQRHTHFLDSPRMTAVLSRSDFRFADLKRRNVSVFLVLPPDRLDTYARWLRLLVSQSLLDMARDAAKPATPVLYLLDEFASLGHLAPIERAMGLMAGYGVQLWPILQDIHQLRATYGERAGTFLSNAGVLQLFGVNDHDSARLVSDLLGQGTVVFNTMARSLDSDKSGLSFSQQHVGRPLLTPDEVRNIPQDVELLFLAGLRPVIARKLAYYADKEFKGRFDQV